MHAHPCRNLPFGKRSLRIFLLQSLVIILPGCSLISAAGPSARAISRLERGARPAIGITIVDVNDEVARRIVVNGRAPSFSDVFGDSIPPVAMVGRGDVLDISIWEAPPAALFGTAASDSRVALSNANPNLTARSTSLPEQMIDGQGMITIPFVGTVRAAGRSIGDIQREIVNRLSGKAHQPQVIIRLIRNATTNVTVVGDVASNSRVPLTPKGERLLDVLATVGGVKQSIDKVTIRVTRGSQAASLPLEAIIRDPRQNIRLQPDDVVTALYQPYSFTALGATGANAEFNFEGTGITLAQALGRVGGLQDFRADVRGVFLFRLEDPAALDESVKAAARQTPDGKVPVIYRIDMKDPATFFVAQGFPIRNKDILYVSNAPLADLQKFLNILTTSLGPVATARTAAQ